MLYAAIRFMFVICGNVLIAFAMCVYSLQPGWVWLSNTGRMKSAWCLDFAAAVDVFVVVKRINSSVLFSSARSFSRSFGDRAFGKSSSKKWQVRDK